MSTEESGQTKESNVSAEGAGTAGAVLASTDKAEGGAVNLFNKGKWTAEEFQYMLGLMEAFKAGHLPLQEGTTLRSFLSSMMKCKPKRISKKFEGISYNGRLTYKQCKDPLSIQAAMLLGARLSELERRHLAAAEERQVGHESIDALLKQAPAPSLAMSSSAPAPASIPLPGVEQMAARRLEPNPVGGLGLGLGMGYNNDSKALSLLKEMELARLGGQGRLDMNTAGGLGQQGREQGTSLLSAGLAAGNEAFRNMNMLTSQRTPSDGQGMNSYHAQLSRELEQQQNQQQLLSLMQQRDKTLTGNSTFEQLSRNSFPNLHNDLLPSVQHNLDINRFVLQAPQDDASYFRQRLLPGMSSSGLGQQLDITAGLGGSGAGTPGLTLADLEGASSSTDPTTRASLSEFLKRQLEQNDCFDPTGQLKRQRR